MSRPQFSRQSIKMAFLFGLLDRAQGSPILCRYDDDTPEDNAYYAGYDPQNDLGLARPEYVDAHKAFAKKLAEECAVALPPPGAPVSECEREHNLDLPILLRPQAD